MPPMNVKVRDHRQFGRKPTVGIHILKTMEPFRCSPALTIEELDDSQGKENACVNITWAEMKAFNGLMSSITLMCCS